MTDSPSSPAPSRAAVEPSQWAMAASLGAMAVGILVLLGWIFHLETLKRLAPNLVAMNPLTAICFVLAGATLWILRRPDAQTTARTPLRRLAQGGAMLVTLAGVLKLLEIGAGVGIGLDRWLFTSQLQDAATGVPNRMAPNTAFNFVCIGAALWGLDVRWKRVYPAQWLGVIAFSASMLAVLGYAYGTKSFYGVGSFIPMALHTALTFLTLVAGILAARPDRGILEALATPSGAIARRLLPAAILLPALLGWLRLEGEKRGWYDSELGISLMVVSLMLVFSALVVWNARVLWRLDVQRERAESQRQIAAQELALSHTEMGKQNAHMQTDLNLAREIQQAFLPQQYITFPAPNSSLEDKLRFYHRYEPNTTLGGDFSDVLLLSDTQAGVLICDVMGHGVRSALVTAIVRGLAEELMSVAHDPGQFLTGINRSLITILQRTSTPLFATSFYLVADLERGELRYASAGHPGPILLHRTQGKTRQGDRRESDRRSDETPENKVSATEVRKDEVRTSERREGERRQSQRREDETREDAPPSALPAPLGPALGVFDDAVYSTSSCALSPGDLLLLYTDGLTEVSDHEGEEWDEPGLLSAVQRRAHLPAEQLLDEIIEEARHFSSSGRFEDDVCLVAMEVDQRDSATVN